MKHASLIRFLSLMLTSLIVLTFCACASDKTPDDTSGGTSDPVSDTDAVDLRTVPVRVMVLSGSTGFGMAPLMDKAAKGEAALSYSFSVENDASVITPALLNGSCDIAALPTNAARVLYAKKPDSIQILCANTLGVLYVMTGEGVTVSSLADLKGKTVYCPAQNPSVIFGAICKESGLEPGTDVFIDTSYAQPAELRTALVTGKVDVAVLPEPMVTIAASVNDKLTVALDLTQEWENAFGEGASLVQGCLVVRTAFAKENSEVIAAFLEEYEASVNFAKDNPVEAGAMIEAQGVFTNGAVAAKAIPKCNLCFCTGEEMGEMLDVFYVFMMGYDLDSVGGRLPDHTPLYYGAVTSGWIVN